MQPNGTNRTNRITPEQERILQLLSAFSYLTTRQVDEYLGGTTTKRATERKLRRLAESGLVGVRLLHPGAGAASERAWFLLEKRGDGEGKKEQYAEEPDANADARSGANGKLGDAATVLSHEHAAVVHLLAEMKQLSTRQIREHLHADRPDWYTWKMLHTLSRRGYIQGARLNPERGAASECYWALTRRGAATIGVSYSRSHAQHPARHTIEYRGLLIKIARQIAGAGWSLISPVPGGMRRLQAEETSQRRQLVEAVLRREGMAIETLLTQGYPASKFKDRIDRWSAGQVGAVVPRKVNEHVAYVPGHPEWTAVLIVHPPHVGRAFWTRSPGVRTESGGLYPKVASRIKRYSRLAGVLPVLAVFASEQAGRQYADLLAAHSLGWTPVNDVGRRLAAIAQSAGIYPPPGEVDEGVGDQ